MFVCSLCKCDFKNVTSLYIHVKNHQIAGNLKIPYYCGQKLKNSGQLCVKNYSSLKSWAAHLRSHHSYLEENDCSDGPTSKYACFDMFVSDDQPTNEMDSNVQEHMMANEDFQCKSSTVSSDMCDMSYVHHIAARSIANLRADSSVTGVASVKAADCCNEVTEPLIQFLQDKVSQFMAKNAPKVDRSCLMELFESAKRPLEFLDSDRKQRKYFKENMGFVEPETVYYGASHRETAYNEGKTRSIQKYDSWQYIPLLDTLRSLFSNTKLIEKLDEPSNANSRVLLDFRHGKKLAENPFFSDKSRKTVAIELYYDDLEPANPLGSKATIHKIAVFYFTIKNLPFHLTCNMANIHLLALAYTDDVAKKYGFDSVLNHFMRDFKILESDGFLVKIDGKEERIFGSLSLVSGDNLAIHTMLGFVGGFNANYFCHTCLALKKDIQSQFDEEQFEFRTVANYESQLQAMSNGDVTTTETGLRQRCILNQLSHWHVTENKTGDLMHDFLEGVGPFEVKLVLSSIVNDKHLSLHEINDRIDNFPYGPTDAKQRPSSIPNMHCDDHSLKQRAMQFWALFRLMPLIIGDAIPSENPYWQFYLDLRAIADLLFAPKWTLGNLNYYRTLYGEHLEKFKLLFPDYNLIPKHHFLIHYATFAENTGPPYKTMVATKEMKGNFLKRNAQVMCNFKNVPYSLAMKHQMFAMSALLSGKVLCEMVVIEKTVSKIVAALPQAQGEELSDLLNVSMNDYVQVATKFNVKGQLYKSGMIVVVSKEETTDLLSFARIDGAVLHEDKLYLLLRVYRTESFEKHFYSYLCFPTDDYCVFPFANLLDFHPLDAYIVSGTTNNFYVMPRYDIF